MGGAMAGLLYDFVYATNATPTKFGGFFAMDYDDDNFDSQGRKPANPGPIQYGMRRTAWYDDDRRLIIIRYYYYFPSYDIHVSFQYDAWTQTFWTENFLLLTIYSYAL